MGVAPFGYRRIIASKQLPDAFRSFARPSSPVEPRYPPVCPKFIFWTTKLHHRPLVGDTRFSRLTRESSSLCSFQGSRDSRDRCIGRTSVEPRSRVSSLKAEQYSAAIQIE